MKTDNQFKIRLAEKSDTELVLKFIKQLAVYEKMSDLVVATPELIEKNVFDKGTVWVFLAFEGEQPVGFALFFETFSTFLGRQGIHLEDLFVAPEYRGKGYGKALINAIIDEAKRRNCGRVEWCCLNWNTPSIEFYKSLGAEQMDDWLTFRLDGDRLK